MVWIVSEKKNILIVLKLSSVFFINSFTLSGICLLFSFKMNKYILGTPFIINDYSLKYIMIALMIIFILGERITTYIKDKQFVSNYLYEIEFKLNGKQYVIDGFLDTGNELRECITNLPCILIEENLISEIDMSKYEKFEIRYGTVKNEGKLIGIKIDHLLIKNKKELFRDIEAIICPCKEKFSDRNNFSALLPRGIV